MAYNKTKHLEAAQKNLNQGKIPLAIEDFKAILKHEPRDQATLMAIGDLFVRQGETFQAIEYFERLAQIFLAEGFVPKAIAIYKKIAKLAPEQTRPIERLAELYVQQGVLSEARPIYLQLAEQHQRAGRNPQAAALLRKLLEAEPDSPRVQTRLAELCLAMDQKGEAADAYRAAAEHLHRRGDHAEAIQYAERAVQTDPTNVAAALLKVRAMIGVGQRTQAIGLLKSLPQTSSGGEAADLLLDLYLEDAEFGRAAELAEKIVAGNNRRFAPAHRVADALLEARDAERALPLLNLVRETMTNLGEHEALSHSLQQAAEQLPGRIEPRDWLVQLYQQASDSFRLPDALAALATALEAAGQYDRACKVYQQILDRDPENEAAKRNYEEAVARMGPGGQESGEESNAGDAAAQAQPEQSAATPGPAGEPLLDEPTRRFVTQSLTDVDLFSSYGLNQKAIDLLEVVLERAPRHVPSMERLLDFYLGAGNERRTAELAAELHEILTERGEFAAAERFEQLQRRFERAADAAAQPPAAPPEAPPDVPAPVAPAPAALPEPAAIREPVAANASSDLTAALARDLETELTVHEVDLSEEWAALAGELKSVTSPSLLDGGVQDGSTVDEILPPPAAESDAPADSPWPAALEEPPQPESIVASGQTGVDAGADPVYTLDLEVMSVPNDAAAQEEADLPDYLVGAPSPAAPESHAETNVAANEAPNEALDAKVDAPAADTRAPEPVAAAPMAAAPIADGPAATPPPKDFLQTLSEDLNAALPAAPGAPPAIKYAPQNLKGVAALPAEKRPAASHFPADTSAPGPLSDLFDDFRAELDALAQDEDPETHYNLGVAYREMGLLEEAISEFQKVAKAGNGFASFRYAMQCCTLLGLSFMDKGQPLIAAMWYERALEIPGLDQETILALRYDLGIAQELAGETAAARKSFSQVYGVNIDYRDVAERLAALGKGT